MSTICDDLRAAILQAAMQGKLTEQLPEDGDAKELISQIKDKKAKLNIKKKELVISEGEILFEIPDNWSWEKLENISQFLGDKNNQIKESATLKDGKYKVISQSKELYIGYCNDEKRVLRITNPVLIFGDHTALVKYIDFDFVIGADGVKVISPFCINIKYLYYALKYNLIGVNELGGYSRHYKFIKDKLIPIPPLAEQKRIVEKVDELMARVADLEQSADALASLKKAFPDDIKASLLQAAMQGKLTKQLPEDGSTEDLLEEIKAEKEKLIAEGKIKKQKSLAPITDDEVPFSIPENWKWARIGDITYNHGQKTPSKRFSYIDVGTLNNIGHRLNDKEQIIEPEKASSRARKIVHKGDVIYATIRPYLHNICIIDRDFSEEPIASTAFAIMSPCLGLYNKYLFWALLSPDFDSYANRSDLSKGVAYPAIGEKDFFNGIIPLPPLAEQKRIVDRLENLMQNINVVGDLIASE